MTENSMEIGKLLVPYQATASHLKQSLIQERRLRLHQAEPGAFLEEV